MINFMRKKILLVVMIAVMCFATVCVSSQPAVAKTATSDAVSNVFFYAKDQAGKNVFLTAMNLKTELLPYEHGASNGKNYAALVIDRLPTTYYSEGRGLLLDELVALAVDKARDNDVIENVEQLAYNGEAKLALLETDGTDFTEDQDNYTYNELYGVKRYFFPKLYDEWKAKGSDARSYFVTGTLDGDANYRDDSGDATPKYFNALRNSIFNAKVETPVYLALSAYGGRVSDLINQGKLNGNVTGEQLPNSLDPLLDQLNAPRIIIPQTERDMRTCTATASNLRKWIYSFRLTPAGTSPIISKGTVATPSCQFALSGDNFDTLTVTAACETEGAEIYHSFNGDKIETTAQYKYEEPIVIDGYGEYIGNNDLKVKLHALKEGFEDPGTTEIEFTKVVYSAKKAALLEIVGYADPDDYADPEKAELEVAVTEGKAAINGANTEQEIATALAESKEAIDEVEPLNRPLPDRKTIAIRNLNNYKEADDYRPAQQQELSDAILAGTNAINAATTAEGVNTALQNAKVAIDQIKTDAQLTKEEQEALAARKVTARAELESYVDLDNYRYKQQLIIAGKILEGTTGINEALTLQDIDTTLIATKADIDTVKTDAQMTAEEKTVADKLGKQGGVKAVSTSYYSAKISWSKNSYAEGYYVFRATSSRGKYSKVATVTSNRTVSYINKSLKTGTAYYYKVQTYKTINDVKVTGELSTAKAVRPALSKPSIRVAAGSKKAVLKWKKISGASGYVIYRATKKSGKYSLVKNIKTSKTVKYTNKKLKKGKRYYYKLRAYRNVSGKKVYSPYSAIKYAKVK